MRHEIQGGRRYYKQYRDESERALTFRAPFRDFAFRELIAVAKKLRRNKNLKSSAEITFVGVHNRRTDYLEFRRKRLGLDNLYEVEPC